jgi:uncharacterized protein YecT (DUF1311 family)
MMRSIKFLVVAIILPKIVLAESIYGSAFDYKKATPVNQYFSGKTAREIASYCKKDALSTMDISSCAQFEFENSNKALTQKIAEVTKELKSNDQSLRAAGEPEALPYFEKAQTHWEIYRENECYSDVYEVGQASSRFADFWDCMTAITKSRLNELKKSSEGD